MQTPHDPLRQRLNFAPSAEAQEGSTQRSHPIAGSPCCPREPRNRALKQAQQKLQQLVISNNKHVGSPSDTYFVISVLSSLNWEAGTSFWPAPHLPPGERIPTPALCTHFRRMDVTTD